ncbi:MAG: PAS domain S-box protein [Nitrospirae bacterium]|nr:PAS domain S-box protein [Nitrospirota bacterium]
MPVGRVPVGVAAELFDTAGEAERGPLPRPQDPMDDLRVKLHWLMGLRVVAVTLLLGLSIAFQIGRGELVPTFYGLIIFTYAITIAYALTLRTLTNPQALTRFAYLQVGVDLLLETFLVARTSGVESPFSVLYVITVTLASLILRRRGGLLTAGVTVVLFGLVTDIQLYGILELIPPSRLSMAETFQTFGIHGLAVIAVGLLSGALAEQLRRADQSLVEKERGLSRLQAFHESILQSISSGVFTADGQGRITSMNRAGQEVTGYAFEAVRNRPWWEVFNWEQRDLFGSTLDRFDVETKRADGSRLVLGLTLSPLTEGDVQIGLVGVFKDLTQIRDMEEQMRRREWFAKIGEMSQNMAHEIRNPLGSLTNAMQMLRKELTLDEDNAHLMDITVREATRLNAIIKEFLLYARPPALNLKECDLNTVLTETLDLIRHEVQSRTGMTVTQQLGDGPMMAQADPDKLKQVFWNLARNAFEAMPSGGRLAISTSRRWVVSGGRSGDVIEIAFQDTGEGIAGQDLDRIFYPFFTTKKEGSGLGLATAQRVVDLHGGWIRVESQKGKGSRFAVCLPVSAEAGPRLWHEGREPWKRY